MRYPTGQPMMLMKPAPRKFVLTTHVTTTVGWIGAVAAYIALVIALLASQDTPTVRATYLAMKLIVWFVIIPASLASLLTGIVQSLGTTWGLFRHWWVIYKLGLTVVGIFVLVEYTQSLNQLASLAAARPVSGADLGMLRNPTHLIHAGGGLLVLLAAQVLAIYKPRGTTRYERRRQHQQRTVHGSLIDGDTPSPEPDPEYEGRTR
jgi:hypothetical protein